MRTPSETDVLTAADAIVSAFAETDTEAYFAGFSPDASFVFHTEPARLNARSDYERLWRGWLAEGWRVVSCESADRLVQTFPGGAVFSHTVRTAVATPSGGDDYRERETIVFRLDDDGRGLVAVHEHLSAFTDENGAAS
ncbi:nuclear transport factor 2 family protein [Leucobacter weissii]|uniref:Nuclear transport factor 2 family protein n=1 Tax=Leucobacter weissii TaxID=1983706 RepID=A0A939SAD0_9MICO|nr:nuclear transport factor 2 family protein [Leucobacter weissii]MBO1901812.1 nuclear transport factor 2 family protein [Leucobacter weissii]